MIVVRSSEERGRGQFGGWLDSRHTFSVANYYDPRHMGFRDLRVINEDRVAGGAGFPTHPHRDMEIISYVIEGAIEHRDSTGKQSVIRPGDVQRMTAGTGVTHSEFNPSPDDPLHFLQIWVLPERRGLTPSYEQRSFSDDERSDRLRLVVDPDGTDGAIRIHQNVRLYSGLLNRGTRISHEVLPDRHAWIQVVDGTLDVSGTTLTAGDGAAVSEADSLEIEAASKAHVLLFDLS
jgi:redox-sensitive bicupin YhaK (pirin superfamily)